MKQNTKLSIQFALLIIVPALIGLCAGYFIHKATVPMPEPVVKYVEVINDEPIDTSAINNWCGGMEDGTIRMVGGAYYVDGVVEDEQGQLWDIDVTIDEQDFLLLWIADNHTPNDPTDDIIIKVWREAY